MMKKNEVKQSDWHPADIKAEISKRGFTFRDLSIAAGYAPDSLKGVLRTPSVPYEKVISDVIGVPAEEIWPSRYELRKRGQMNKVS
ncbi:MULTISPECIES: helix-turn-helix domain-containing protein [Morganellaceae]|uniref:helix-turn-helix domain-containing protein n=1 Tax=Morganellaceae TaxID=1903414 RepID=UPI000D588491|nr:winged helix-turn-helix DNA-binding family protein [Proteus mirabilis]PVF84713.1 winged helix-turn-helix DNA-binding family protein [Proteus mirabilis]